MGVTGGPLYLFGPTGDADVLVEGTAGTAEYLLNPVVGISILIHVHIVVNAEVGDILGIEFAVHHGHLIHRTDIVIRTHRLDGILVRHLLEAGIGIVGNADLALRSGLCRHEHYTVGATAAINGGREGVLEDVDALDVGRRNVVNALYRESVHDIKR